MTDIKAQFDPNLRKSIKRKKQVAVIPIDSIEATWSTFTIN